MRIRFKLSIILVVFFTFVIISTIPRYVNASDYTTKIFSFIEKGDWKNAENTARASKNSALLKVTLAQKFLDNSYVGNKFEDAVNFVNANPYWPQIDKIIVKMEGYISDSTSKKAIFDWFSKNAPKTASGHKSYALAAAKFMNHNDAKFSNIIKNGWIYGAFDSGEEKSYKAQFGKYIDESDHISKIDEYLWNNDIAAARKSFDLVSSGYKKAFEATIAIIEKKGDKDRIFNQIPEQYYTSNLLYRYLCAKKTEEPNSKSISLFHKVKRNKKHADEWAKLQNYYAREFIDKKDFASSYKIASQHFATNTENIAEMEWLSGFLALRFLHKYDAALNHFQKLSSVAGRPISVARSYYWLGRTYEAKGNMAQANKYYKEASIYNYTFYGQVALIDLKSNIINLPQMPKLLDQHRNNIENHDLVKAAKLLIQSNKTELAHMYLKAAIEHATKEELMWLAEIVKTSRSPYYIAEFGKHVSYQHIMLKDYAFPTPYQVSSEYVEPALIYSIIRQESVFNQYAISHAKAMGLMQLIKDTACRTAKSINVQCDVPRLTKDAAYNIKLGSAHLKQLMKERGDSYVVMLSSYNTSTCNSNKWLQRFGDPRQMKDHREVIDWIELIPFAETRNYVQRVLENVQVYRAILNKSNKLMLKSDLL